VRGAADVAEQDEGVAAAQPHADVTDRLGALVVVLLLMSTPATAVTDARQR